MAMPALVVGVAGIGVTVGDVEELFVAALARARSADSRADRAGADDAPDEPRERPWPIPGIRRRAVLAIPLRRSPGRPRRRRPAAGEERDGRRRFGELAGHRARTEAGSDSRPGSLTEELRKLRRERALFFTIINSVTDPIMLTDTEGRLIVANSRAEKLFAASEEEASAPPGRWS